MASMAVAAALAAMAAAGAVVAGNTTTPVEPKPIITPEDVTGPSSSKAEPVEITGVTGPEGPVEITGPSQADPVEVTGPSQEDPVSVTGPSPSQEDLVSVTGSQPVNIEDPKLGGGIGHPLWGNLSSLSAVTGTTGSLFSLSIPTDLFTSSALQQSLEDINKLIRQKQFEVEENTSKIALNLTKARNAGTNYAIEFAKQQRFTQTETILKNELTPKKEKTYEQFLKELENQNKYKGDDKKQARQDEARRLYTEAKEKIQLKPVNREEKEKEYETAIRERLKATFEVGEAEREKQREEKTIITSREKDEILKKELSYFTQPQIMSKLQQYTIIIKKMFLEIFCQ